jgi:DnaJ-domain-containing protein 1
MSVQLARVARLIALVVGAVAAPVAVSALGTAPLGDAPDADPPTAIELALIQHRCNLTDTSSAGADAQRCLDAQLLVLRADFGRNLVRLARSDRQKIDAACSRLHRAMEHEAYLDCLSDGLAAVHARSAPENVAVSNSAAPPAVRPPSIARTPPVPPTSRWRSIMIAGGLAGIGVAVVAAVRRATRPRRPRRQCRGCGLDVLDSDLCPACRHEAAEALRRAAAERTHAEAAQEHTEAPQEEVGQTRACADDARQAEYAAHDDESVSGPESVSVVPVVDTSDAPVGVDEEQSPAGAFDPYVVLGISPEAGEDEVRAAYEQAKAKYAPDLVSFLGDEAQAHFTAKAQSVERAYEMLTSGVQSL